MTEILLKNVQRYYGEILTGKADLRTDACCTADAVPDAIQRLLADIHPQVSDRYYGCGLVAPDELEGLRILDLGCGSGRDVYLLSRLVGEHGQVVGVDMTPAQLAVARRHQDYHRDRYGYQHSNVAFLEGQIEQLDRLGLEPGSFDLIVSNCVINLSPDKAAVLGHCQALLRNGGEMYFSDVYSDRRIPPALLEDPVLHGECLAGALYWRDFLHLAGAAGFIDPRLVEDRPLAIDDAQIRQRLSPAAFFSATYRLFKLDGLEPAAEDYGDRAIYLGSIPGHAEAWSLDRQTRFPTGQPVAISGNTRRILQESRFAAHLQILPGEGLHQGAFPAPGGQMPFDTTLSTRTSACC